LVFIPLSAVEESTEGKRRIQEVKENISGEKEEDKREEKEKTVDEKEKQIPSTSKDFFLVLINCSFNNKL
jgi:hypothetical protein